MAKKKKATTGGPKKRTRASSPSARTPTQRQAGSGGGGNQSPPPPPPPGSGGSASTPPAGWETRLLEEFPQWRGMDLGIGVGIVLSLLLGATIALLGTWASGSAWAGVPLGIAVTGYFFTGGLFQVPVQNRGVFLVLGRRIRVNPSDWMGFEEGWNWTPIPFPFSEIQMENVKRRIFPDPNDPDTPRYGQNDAQIMDIADYAKNRVKAHLFMMIEFWTKDPYLLQSVEDPFIGLIKLSERAARQQIMEHTTLQLIKLDRTELSDKVREDILRDLQPDGIPSLTRWGLELGTVRVPNIEVDEDLAAAWKKKSVEEAEKVAEKIEADAQVEQVRNLVQTGVSANVAIAARLMSQGKEGAQIHQVNLEGLDPSIAEAAKEVGKGLQRLNRRRPRGGGEK